MAVSGSRMEYQDPDIRDTREYVAARRAMVREAYEQPAQGSTTYRSDSSASASTTADSLPELELTSEEGSTSRSTDGAVNASDSRASTPQSEGLVDRVGASQNALASVDQSQVQSGVQQGVFSRVQFGVYDNPQDVANALQWLDTQIPRDGTVATEDRRTALLIATASATAQLRTEDPARQQELAYDYLFALRDGITRYGSQLPEGMGGRRGDPDIAAAEHFFENSRFVTNNALQVGDLRIPVPSLISAAGMAAADLIYQYGKRLGLISGSSQAGNYQTGWEFAGILAGLGGGQVPPESGWEGWEDYDHEMDGDGVDRIVIIGDRLSNENRVTESGAENIDAGTVPSGSTSAGSSIDSNGGLDSGILADGARGGSGGGGYDGGGYGGGGYDGGGYGGGGYDGGGGAGGGGGGGGSLFLFNNE